MCIVSWFAGSLCEFVLNAARQFVLAFGCHKGVFARHFKIAVASNFGGLEGASTNLLTPADICSAERVRS